MRDRYRELLHESLESFVYASEEADPTIIGPDADPDLCILVDPLDTSELAVRGLHGYTQVLAYSRPQRRPIAAVVGDIYHHIQLYVAGQDDDGDHAYAVTADGAQMPLLAQPTPDLAGSLVTNYLMRPAEGFSRLAQQHQLLDALSKPSEDGRATGRIGVDFGSVGLCHVAAGMTDAMIEFAKGFAIWDLLPGQYILTAAGGTVFDLEGNELHLDRSLNSLADITNAMNQRQRFVAARSRTLARQLLCELQSP
jgi:myo-inositol-1(or 4)-monophosphatase